MGNFFNLDNLPEEELLSLCKRVAYNHSAPSELLRVMAENITDTEVLGAIADNPLAPVDILIRLSYHEEPWIIWGVARNPSTPPEVLTRLAYESKYYLILRSVEENPSTPKESREVARKRMWFDPPIENNPSFYDDNFGRSVRLF